MRSVSKHTRNLWKELSNKKLFLACSGGVDSMVLMHMLSTLKCNLSVIHVNYQLRGEASNQDASLVESTCRQLNIPVHIRTVNLKKKLENGGNLQDEARKVRYDWFFEILAKDSNNRIALAHHQDDQVETFFMNLARKSGVLGLACMKPEHGGIVRPLLDFSKAEILKYAESNLIKWREDQSNASNAYTRNRLRNEFIPFLKTEIPNLSSSVSFLTDSFQKTQGELEQNVRALVESIRKTNLISIKAFKALSEWEQVELLRQLNISASYVSRILDLTERGKQLEFNNSDFDSLVLDEDQYTFLKTETFSFQLTLEEIISLPKEFNKDMAYFDASKIDGELKARKWTIGDRISPLGMSGSQLISDIIKDAKITSNSKKNQLVVHDDESILWCVGLKISRKAIATPESDKIVRCSVIVSKVEESELP